MLALLAAAAALMAQGTAAYVVTNQQTGNALTAGGVGIILHEYADESGTPFDASVLDKAQPGQSVTDRVVIENAGRSAAWVRVRADVWASSGAAGKEDISEYVLFDIDEDHWKESGDGWYYYKLPLSSGSMTEPLFTQLTIDGSMGNEYQNRGVTLELIADATQSAFNGDAVTGAKDESWPMHTAGD